MGIKTSKVDIQSSPSQTSFKSIYNKGKRNLSKKYFNQQQKNQLTSYKTNDIKDAQRKISKVRFADDGTKGISVEDTGETEKPAGRRNKILISYTSRISHISVTCYNNTDETDTESSSNTEGSSTRQCILSASTSQLTFMTSEDDDEDEDEVFTEGFSKMENSKEAKTTGNRVYRKTISHISVACYEDIGGRSPASTGSGEESEENEKRHQGRVSQFSITCYDAEIKTTEINSAIDSKDSGKVLNTFESRISHVSVSYSIKDEDKNSNTEEKDKKKRRMTRIHLEDTVIEVGRTQKEIAQYCLPLLATQFIGQTTTSLHTDVVDQDGQGNLHLGVYLELVDKYLRSFNNPYQFSGTEPFYNKLLYYIATKRKGNAETVDQCFERLQCDSERFVQIYHKRGEFSQELKDHRQYWGSRQQLLSAKVISDWVDKENGPLDPIFGALLQPTTGRCGPGDSCWFHHKLFDGNGHMAYHSAVHDAFGYLMNYHQTGPGYDYMATSLLRTSNPLSGQFNGISFWKKVLKHSNFKQHSVMSLSSAALTLLHMEQEKDNSKES